MSGKVAHCDEPFGASIVNTVQPLHTLAHGPPRIMRGEDDRWRCPSMSSLLKLGTAGRRWTSSCPAWTCDRQPPCGAAPLRMPRGPARRLARRLARVREGEEGPWWPEQEPGALVLAGRPER